MKLLTETQALLDAAGAGSIRLDYVCRTSTGLKAWNEDWIVLAEVMEGPDLVPIWQLMLRLQQQEDKPVLAILLDEQSPRSRQGLRLETEKGAFPGLLIHVYGQDAPEVLEAARRIPELYHLH